MATVRSYSIFFANDTVTKVVAYDGADTAAKTDTGDDVLHVVKSTDLADVSNENLLSLLNHLRPEGSEAFATLPVRKDAIKRISQSLVAMPVANGEQPAAEPTPAKADKEAEKAAKAAEKAAQAEAKAKAKADKERLMAEAKAAKEAKATKEAEELAKRKADGEAALATAQAVGADEEKTLRERLDALLKTRDEAVTKVYEQYPELKAKKRKSPGSVVGGGKVGIIDLIKENLLRTEGASVKELRDILAAAFPDRDADGMTSTIRTQLAQLPKKLDKPVRKVTDEARGGTVYYLA